jgi:type II secretory pathway component HofQ
MAEEPAVMRRHPHAGRVVAAIGTLQLASAPAALEASGRSEAAGTETGAPATEAGERARPATERPLSLEMRDASVVDVLLLLAEHAGLNLVVDEEVGGTITLRLRNVRWEQAFSTVLRDRGLGYEREGNVLRVASQEKLLREARRRAEREREPDPEAAPRIRIIPVSHARASELAAHVQAIVGDEARVTYDARTNVLIVYELRPRGRRETDAP